jgi:dihydroneopterin aldolase
MTMSSDRIHIRDLKVRTRLGVPEAERRLAQTVSVTIVMEPAEPFDSLGDQIGRTVDYHAVARRVAEIAGQGERRLAETLALELADALLAEFPLHAVEVEIEKTILPQAAGVGVKVRREQPDSRP